VIDFFTRLPARLLAMADAALGHPIVWVALVLVLFGAAVLGGMQLHLTRQARRDRQNHATRYDTQEIR
jgi:hypothetical protein